MNTKNTTEFNNKVYIKKFYRKITFQLCQIFRKILTKYFGWLKFYKKPKNLLFNFHNVHEINYAK